MFMYNYTTYQFTAFSTDIVCATCTVKRKNVNVAMGYIITSVTYWNIK